MPSIRHTSPLLRYGVAVLAVGVAFGLKLLLDPLIVQDVPFLLVFGAIMVSAWFGGLDHRLLLPRPEGYRLGVQPGKCTASRILPRRYACLPACRGAASREVEGGE